MPATSVGPCKRIEWTRFDHNRSLTRTSHIRFPNGRPESSVIGEQGSVVRCPLSTSDSRADRFLVRRTSLGRISDISARVVKGNLTKPRTARSHAHCLTKWSAYMRIQAAATIQHDQNDLVRAAGASLQRRTRVTCVFAGALWHEGRTLTVRELCYVAASATVLVGLLSGATGGVLAARAIGQRTREGERRYQAISTVRALVTGAFPSE